MLVYDYIRSKHERQAYEELARYVQELRTEADEGPMEVPKYAESGVLYQYDELWQKNKDMAGWLSLEGTSLDYPVMLTPEEPEYYLRRAFDGSSSDSGSLFLDSTWTPESNHAIIYGHNMKNGTMFGNLLRYESSQYAQEHPVIRFDTLRQEGEYRVLAMFYNRDDDSSQAGFPYYKYADLSDPQRFAEYVSNVKAVSLYNTGVSAEYGDKLLTLSTCSYHTANGRFVLVAVQDGGEA